MDSFGSSFGLLALQNHQRISLWRTSSPPSSGYGTEPSSPTDSTGSWNHQPNTLPAVTSLDGAKEDQKSPCCSLINSIWRTSSLQTSQNNSSSSTSRLQFQPYLNALEPRGSRSTISPPDSSSWLVRYFSSPIVSRAIVTLDAEQIGPEDKRHHPLDVEKPDIFMRKPWGLATNSLTEQIYIADRQQNVIMVFGPDGEFLRKFGGQGLEVGLFNKPAGIAFDAINDRIFISDKDNHRVQVFSASTEEFKFTFGSRGSRPGQFIYPWGITVSPNGKYVAVADARNHRVQLFTSSGEYIRRFCLNTGMFDQRGKPIRGYPRGIVFDKAGQFLYITDFNLHRIIKLDINFRRAETIADDQQLKRPSGIEVDHAGNILVCDTRHNRVKIFRPDGQSLGYLQRIGNSLFDLPLDISVMPAGQVAVLDLNGRVRVF